MRDVPSIRQTEELGGFIIPLPRLAVEWYQIVSSRSCTRVDHCNVFMRYVEPAADIEIQASSSSPLNTGLDWLLVRQSVIRFDLRCMTNTISRGGGGGIDDSKTAMKIQANIANTKSRGEMKHGQIVNIEWGEIPKEKHRISPILSAKRQRRKMNRM